MQSSDSAHLLPARQRDRCQTLLSKVSSQGASVLDDHELLEMLVMHTGQRGKAQFVAEDLMQTFGSLPKIFAADRTRAQSVTNDTMAAHLAVIAECSARLARKQIEERPLISCWDALIDYCRTQIANLDHEVFHVLFLDKANHLIADERMGLGTVDHVPVYPREVLKRALELNACAIILVHNHPSGDPTPSDTDIAMTQMIKSTAEGLSITLHDHVVIAASGEVSMVASGIL